MSLRIEKKVSLKGYTTLKVGGVAGYLVEVNAVEDLRQALNFAEQNSAPLLILGEGSNVLISDDGFKGLVIINKIKGVTYQEKGNDVFATFASGEILDEVIADTVSKNYWGLENLSAIPGTVGATPIQNVGAYGVEVSDLIIEIFAINIKTKEEKIFTTTECKFSYRDSFFKTDAGKDWLVLDVTFKLSKVPTPKLTYGSLKELAENKNISLGEIRNEIIKIRSTKFPNWREVGTAGSFFKNPIINNDHYKALLLEYPDLPSYPESENNTKVSLGWILDNVCHLKGFSRDGVSLYEKQALVLINDSATSAKQIDDFADFVKEKVKEKTGIEIEREVRNI